MRQVIPYPKNEIVLELTDDWVECFSKPENQNGFMWVMAAQDFLPEGVDGSDKRVIGLCKMARDYYLERRRANEETKDNDSTK